MVCDPLADPAEVKKLYGIHLTSYQKTENLDAIVLAVAHREFLEIEVSDLLDRYRLSQKDKRVFLDVKGVFDRKTMNEHCIYWRL